MAAVATAVICVTLSANIATAGKRAMAADYRLDLRRSRFAPRSTATKSYREQIPPRERYEPCASDQRGTGMALLPRRARARLICIA